MLASAELLCVCFVHFDPQIFSPKCVLKGLLLPQNLSDLSWVFPHQNYLVFTFTIVLWYEFQFEKGTILYTVKNNYS